MFLARIHGLGVVMQLFLDLALARLACLAARAVIAIGWLPCFVPLARHGITPSTAVDIVGLSRRRYFLSLTKIPDRAKQSSEDFGKR